MENTPNNLLPALPAKTHLPPNFSLYPAPFIPIITCIQAQVDNMDKNNTNNNKNYDLTSGYTADDEEAPAPSRTTLIWNRVLKITLLVDLVLILIVGSYCLYKYIGGDEIVPPAADLEYTPQPFNQKLAKEVLDYQDPNPLMSAIATDQPLSAIQEILGSGIDVNAQDATGNTALHYAIFREDRKLIKLLLNHGADVDIKNNKDIYPVRLSFDYSLDQTSSILVFPEDYDDNGIITRAGLLRSTFKSTQLFILIAPSVIFSLIFALIAIKTSGEEESTISDFFISSVQVYFVIFSATILIYYYKIFTLKYPYQYIITYTLRDFFVTGIALLILIITYLAYLGMRQIHSDK